MGQIRRTVGAITATLGILSFLLLYQHAVGHGWSAVIDVLLNYYSDLKALIFEKFHILDFASSLVHLLNTFFSISVDLAPHWSDVVVLLALYLGARARSYWISGLQSRALFRAFLGTVISLVGGVLSGIVPPDTFLGNVIVLLSVLVSLAFFEILDAFWSASFFRKAEQSWIGDAVRYLKFSTPALAIGFLPLSFVAYFGMTSPSISEMNFGMIGLIIYVVMLATYWVFRGFQSSQSWEKEGSGYERFIASSNTQIGLQMLKVIVGALFVICADAGLNE